MQKTPLILASKKEEDKAYRQALRLIRFKEYQYTCIGYGNNNTSGAGAGRQLSQQMLASAKEIAELAENNPSMFKLLPLLEDGIGADIISDITQNIIDDDICRFTTDIMQELNLQGAFTYLEHTNNNQNTYKLLKNPFNGLPIKLLPKDILLDLPLAKTFDNWLLQASEVNKNLRDRINKKVGSNWYELAKGIKKSTLLHMLKTDKAFFVEVLKELQATNFSPYNVEIDHKGLHNWLNHSKHYLKSEQKPKIIQLEDNLTSLEHECKKIIDYFSFKIEQEENYRLFWAKISNKKYHKNESYSQKLFCLVAETLINESSTNLQCKKVNLNGSLYLELFVSAKYSVYIYLKHSNNNMLANFYNNIVKKYQSHANKLIYFVVFNFNDEPSKALINISKNQDKAFKVVTINASDQEQNNENTLFDFKNEYTELEGFVHNIQVLGGSSSNKHYKPLRDQTKKLCHELLNTKTYNTQVALTKDVAKLLETKHKELLTVFTPHKSHLREGTDWKIGTFAKWCAGCYKGFYGKQ